MYRHVVLHRRVANRGSCRISCRDACENKLFNGFNNISTMALVFGKLHGEIIRR
jgi:hypothetical protein